MISSQIRRNRLLLLNYFTPKKKKKKNHKLAKGFCCVTSKVYTVFKEVHSFQLLICFHSPRNWQQHMAKSWGSLWKEALKRDTVGEGALREWVRELRLFPVPQHLPYTLLDLISGRRVSKQPGNCRPSCLQGYFRALDHD